MSALQVWPDEQSYATGARSGYRKRSATRTSNPHLAVNIRGKLYQTLNWSLGGILLGDYDGALCDGEEFEIESVGMAGKQMWPVLIRARVVRTGGERGTELAAQFLTISAPAFDILEGIMLRRSGYRGAA